jgi:hypothetical protein
LSLGTHVEVLEPEELRDSVRSAAAGVVELYGNADRVPARVRSS